MASALRKLLLGMILVLALTFPQLSVMAQKVNPSNEGPQFSDHFDGAILDSTKWVTQLNTNASGYSGYGGKVTLNGGRVFLSSSGTSFPCVTTAANPFPIDGDFLLDFNVNYTNIRGWGSGFWVTKGPFKIGAYGEWANILQIWAGSQFGIVAMLLGNWTYIAHLQDGIMARALAFRLEYSSGNYCLYMDGVPIAQASSELRPDSIGFGHEPAGYIPWSAPNGTWTSFNVDYVKILRESKLSVVTSASSTAIGYTIDIGGKLTNSIGEPLKGKTVFLSCAVSKLPTWTVISSVTTDQDGAYSVAWLPTATGDFMVKVAWSGDEVYAGTQESRNVSVTRNKAENLFYAESNSTLSSLSFNATTSQISFTVSGHSGTTGYVRFLVSKSFMTNITALNVLIDERPINCTVSSLNDCWQIYFAYSHSTHTVTIEIPESSSVPEFPVIGVQLLFLVMASIVITVLVRNKKKFNKK